MIEWEGNMEPAGGLGIGIAVAGDRESHRRLVVSTFEHLSLSSLVPRCIRYRESGLRS